jgi:hypothetical protein
LPVDCEPLVACAPDHAPDAVHEVALLEDQVRVELEPLATVLGLALKLTVALGLALTVTVADCEAVPPVPVQVNVNVEVALSAPVDCVPLNALVPIHAPEAVQEDALVTDQFKVALLPLTIALGPTLSTTVGAGALTVTVADCAALPPGPVQLNE